MSIQTHKKAYSKEKKVIEIKELYWNYIKKIANRIVSSIAFRLLGLLLIFVDLALMVTDIAVTSSKLYIPLEYRSISFVIALYFLVDILLQVYVKGNKHYFSDILNILDAIIIGIILLIDVTYIFFYAGFFKDIQRMSVFFRLLRLVTLMRIFHLANQKRHLERVIRRLVSGNKRRYEKDGFDLDLTYITERLIAMSFPSSGKHSFYRNPMEEVTRFLESRHAEHYFVYNLCSERSYDPKYFHHRMHRIMIDDHNVPSLEEMILFSKEVIAWLSKDPQNIIVIHCKGGKGRTGTMICVCLIATGTFLTAKESLKYFGDRRTDTSFSKKFQGVETPSQSRYVGYFETIRNVCNWQLPLKKILKITKIVIYSIQGIGQGDGKDLNIEIVRQHRTVLTCTLQTCTVLHDPEKNRAIFIVPNCPDLQNDVKVRFLSMNLPNHYDECAFFFWFHASMIEGNRLYLTRNELDNPHNKNNWSIYRPDFAVEIIFEEVFS
ncbi:phosphatidylinositol 3,4,5-trisphosphate 3-phosphatase TPTE2-like [Dipodomys spectabilis]|uniref:phosphatidylinositol 3,4,5-trisphosphate 3-phosphatase TPTE2-like n=1 Tax=Dipodomys spectabilis TaxID=105255 RepID=UPI001C54A309|nr:phosphatidylinositol 3,4,5-trisphosphate 3-phosphatase TPTE2-like [Dipodomys spectabilis]